MSKEAPREVAKGDCVLLRSSGGGGWGDPLDRAPEKVYADVLDEIITPRTAEEVYGVILTENGVDEEATARKREQMR